MLGNASLGAVGEFRARDSLAQGCLVYAVGGRDGLGNLARDQMPTIGGTGNGLTTVAAAHGPALATDGSINGFISYGSTVDVSPGTGDFAFAFLVNQGSLANSFGLFVSGGIEVLFGAGGGNVTVRFNGANVNGGTTATGQNDGRHHIIVFSRAKGVCTFWVDGILISSGTDTTNITATSALHIGKRGSTATYYAIPGVGMVGYWNRSFSDEEIRRVSADPFALVRLTRDWLLHSASAPISGSTSKTLGALTSTSAAALALKATSGVTLGALNATSVADLIAKGQTSKTLGALSGSSAALLALNATSGVTLGALTSIAIGAIGYVPITGIAAISLGALTSTSAAALAAHAISSGTFGALTSTSAAALAVHAGSAPMLGILTSVSAGISAITGIAGIMLGPLTAVIFGGDTSILIHREIVAVNDDRDFSVRVVPARQHIVAVGE